MLKVIIKKKTQQSLEDSYLLQLKPAPGSSAFIAQFPTLVFCAYEAVFNLFTSGYPLCQVN